MKTSQRKTKDPCRVCFMHHDFCICSEIPSLDLKTRVSVVVHYKELKRTSNTGRLAVTALKNSEMIVRGLEQTEATDLSRLIHPDYENLLLYPSDDSEELQTQSKPVHLIVPDGNWRQASKVHYRHPELSHIKRVKLRPAAPATQFMRKEHVEGGMATLEAIASALYFLEGHEVSETLMKFYKLKLSQTLKARGGGIN